MTVLIDHVSSQDIQDCQPVGATLLIKVLDVREQTVSGLYLPKTAIQKEQKGSAVGVVLRRGRGYLNKKTGAYVDHGIRAGDVVVFALLKGQPVRQDEKLRFMDADDILAVVPIALAPTPEATE